LPDRAGTEVGSVVVRVVTDSYHHAFEPTRKVGDPSIQRYAFALAKDRPPRKALHNEWGLSLHVESRRGAESRQILIDFGYTPETPVNNLELPGVDPSQLDALMLGHGHDDHFGGMVGFLAAHRAKLKEELPFCLGGEACSCTREAGVGDSAGSFGALDRQAIADAGPKVTCAEQPSVISGHAFSTGQIAAASFEKVLAPTRMKPGFADTVGCKPEGLAEAKRSLAVVPDDFSHEQATCFHVKGKGLVVMTSCGHRGVVDSVRRVMAVSGVAKVHAVMGGFHLAPHAPEYQREPALALEEINPDWLIPMHCSGETFIALAMQELPGRVPRSSTGTRFTFACALPRAARAGPEAREAQPLEPAEETLCRIRRPFSRSQSRCFSVSRLSCCAFPLASATSTFTRPSFQCRFSGTSVKPRCSTLPIRRRISSLCIRSFLVRSASGLTCVEALRSALMRQPIRCSSPSRMTT
jgi:7,8-dihydropterin-6-yl-methyl-4-(beta-D-ribofuranosyl)aminobenzene 5'-phosphate synthase